MPTGVDCVCACSCLRPADASRASVCTASRDAARRSRSASVSLYVPSVSTCNPWAKVTRSAMVVEVSRGRGWVAGVMYVA
jgi:hypothetical protein